MASAAEVALLEAIVAAPDDDAARLVYADRLLERGDPRGEFIELSCAYPRLPRGPERGALEGRAQQLLEQHRQAWLAPLGLDDEHTEVVFQRGFPHAVTIEREDAVAHLLAVAPRLFAAGPVRAVHLRARVLESYSDGNYYRAPLGDVAALARAPWLARVEWLALVADDEAPTAALAALAAAPGLAALRWLTLEECATDDLARVLARSPHLGRLRHLALRSKHVGDDGATALAAAASLAELETLWLDGTRVTGVGARALAARPGLPGLRALWLAVAPIGPAGAEAFAESPLTARLRELHLGACKLGRTGARALGHSPYAAQIATLLVDYWDIGRDEGAYEFSLGPHPFPGLLIQGQNTPYDPERPRDPFSPFLAGQR